MPSTSDLVAVLDRLLGPGSAEVRVAPRAARLGLALDPPPADDDLGDLDALLLHRSWGFDPPPGLGVVACHDPMDRALGLAGNRRLHRELGLRDGEEVRPKVTVHQAPADIADRVTAAFGGREDLHAGDGRRVRRVAMADAMTEETVRWAAGRGADLYVTGSWRVPGAAAAGHSGIAVLVVGHARQERHALTTLGRLLGEHGFAADVRMR